LRLKSSCGMGPMHAFTPKLKRLASIVFALLATALLLSTIVWSPSVAHLLHSRLVVGLAGIWCGATGALVHPEFWPRLTYGIHEFRRGCNRALDDFDDDFK
jgi:hypothetical protein